MTSAPFLPCAPAGAADPADPAGTAGTGSEGLATDLLDPLDPLDRRVLRLCLRDGLPPHEAARRLGRTSDDVEHLLVRVLRELRLDLVDGSSRPAPALGDRSS